ncbi:hypothetical protein H8356DRAFT_913544, partial [Neocallimastix lanati (nom. inval.)]
MANLDISFEERNNIIMNLAKKDFILDNKNFENKNLYFIKNQDTEKLTESELMTQFNNTTLEDSKNSKPKLNDNNIIGKNILEIKDNNLKWTDNEKIKTEEFENKDEINELFSVNTNFTKTYDNFFYFSEKKPNTNNNKFVNEICNSGKYNNSNVNNNQDDSLLKFRPSVYKKEENNFTSNNNNEMNFNNSFAIKNYKVINNTINNVNNLNLYKNNIDQIDNKMNNRINLQNNTVSAVLESDKNQKFKKMKQNKQIKKKNIKNDKQNSSSSDDELTYNNNSLNEESNLIKNNKNNNINDSNINSSNELNNYINSRDGQQNQSNDQDFQCSLRSVNERIDNGNNNSWNNNVDDLENKNTINNNNNNNIATFKKKKGKNGIPKKGKSGNGHSKYYKELICEKCGEKPTQFGLLSTIYINNLILIFIYNFYNLMYTKYLHIYIIFKIWRVPESDSEKFSHKCPICNVPSFHFIPSDIYCHSGPLKKHIIDRFRTRCSRISCKFYERVRHDGSHYCPFGQMCLFAHKDSNGVDIKKLDQPNNYDKSNESTLNNELLLNFDDNFITNSENFDKFSTINNTNLNNYVILNSFKPNEKYISFSNQKITNPILSNIQYYNNTNMNTNTLTNNNNNYFSNYFRST